MALLKVYNNGHEASNASSGYRFTDLMNDFFGENAPRMYSSPRVNIAEGNDSFTIFMAVPGVEKSEISLNVEKDVMTISRKKEIEKEEKVNFTRREYSFGSFERSFNLPEDIDVEKIGASMENGILKIVLPKKDEAIDRGPVTIKIS